MNTTDILALANRCGVSLRAEGERLLASPRERVMPELGAALRGNKPALMLVLRSKSWPWLSDSACRPDKSVCNCGGEVWWFTDAGQPQCRRCSGRHDEDFVLTPSRTPGPRLEWGR